jgi:hypothetical protein
MTRRLLCIAKVYRGLIVEQISGAELPRAIVFTTANRKPVQLFQCSNFAEACAWIEAELQKTTLPVLPVRETDGGARAVGLYGNGSIQTA